MKPEKKTTPRKAAAPKAPAATLPAESAQPRPRTRRAADAVATKSAPPKPAPRKRAVRVPSILLEGDAPATPPVGGPGQRYALGPTPPPEHFGKVEEQDLPEAYGTQKLLLAARDPQWLYAHWDLSREQLREYNALSADRHLVIRVYIDAVIGEPFNEVHVHPESRNWFIHVGRGGTRYVAELGYHAKADGKWLTIATSSPTLTPPDALSPDTSVQFATIPVDVPFEHLLALVKAAVREHVPLAEAILQLRAAGYEKLPGAADLSSARWTRQQEHALAQLISMDQVRRVWVGSLEITELIRRQLAQEISSAAAAQFSLPTSPAGAVSSVSSPYGGAERKKGFWFNVNAELILYGATEPDAKVTIGGRAIKLRPDGSFSYRFALPDGKYELPVVAASAEGDDSRSAELKFNRSTKYRGDVGAHPQDPALKTPHAAHVA